MNERVSTISLKYPTYRDNFIRGTYSWLDGKRIDDNAEGLWRIHSGLYDLSAFIKNHPGGREWLELTKGTDITEAFESHHISPKANLLLPKFYIRNASQPRNYLLTFEDDGFYKTLKRRVAKKIPELDLRPVTFSNFYCDVILFATFTTSICAARWNNFYIGGLAAVFLMWTTVISHNYLHMANNFRMYTMNLSLMSWRDWRVFHVLSHHMLPNSYHDLEVTLFEPHLKWIPYKDKSFKDRYISWVISPVVYLVNHFVAFLMRIPGIFKTKQKVLFWDELIFLLLPLSMFCLGRLNVKSVLIMWLFIVGLSSFFYRVIAVNSGHHSPEIIHEGDEVRSLDFGMFQMGATVDRVEGSKTQFMILTTFGEHTLHHMFPTLDQGLLPQLHDVSIETCKDFDIEFRKFSWYKLFKGQYRELARNEPSSLC